MDGGLEAVVAEMVAIVSTVLHPATTQEQRGAAEVAFKERQRGNPDSFLGSLTAILVNPGEAFQVSPSCAHVPGSRSLVDPRIFVCYVGVMGLLATVRGRS